MWKVRRWEVQHRSGQVLPLWRSTEPRQYKERNPTMSGWWRHGGSNSGFGDENPVSWPLDYGAIWIKELHWKVFSFFSLSYVYIIPHFLKKVNKINRKFLFLWKISQKMNEIYIFYSIFYGFIHKTRTKCKIFHHFVRVFWDLRGWDTPGVNVERTPGYSIDRVW